jgi:molecular chaperone GrpE
VGEERPKGEDDSDALEAEPSLEELAAEASSSVLEAEPNALSQALDIPAVDDAAQAFLKRAHLAEDRLAEVLAAYRKVKSDNDGFRDRLKRTLERQYDQRRDRLLLRFIDILDNFDRALDATQTTYAGEPLVEGLILVRTQLLQALKEHGLERVPVLGLPYDPHVSEAVGTQPVEDPDHHHLVVKELLRGYRLNGKVARPSRVLIGECGAAPEEAAPPAVEAVVEAAVEVEAEPVLEPEPVTEDPPAAPLLSMGDLSLEEIIARAEAQDALFPAPELEADAPIEVAPEPDPVPSPVAVAPPEAVKAVDPTPAQEAPGPFVLTDSDADSLASALDEEVWPEGLDLGGPGTPPVIDPGPRRKR